MRRRLRRNTSNEKIKRREKEMLVLVKISDGLNLIELVLSAQFPVILVS